MELIVNNISKTIRKRVILSDVNLCLKSGTVYGFAGRNGSGKTMLFRALSGLMRIDSGSIVWEGKTLHKDFSVLPSLGIIIENVSLYPHLTGKQNLIYLADLTKRIGQEEIIHAITRVGLDPDVIMLDEPTNALDETGVEEIRKIILEERERGALVLVASHNKEDIKVLADELYRVENGQVIKQEAGL